MGKLFSKKVLATMLSAGLLATSSGALSAFASSEVKQSVSQAVEAYDKKLNKKDFSKAKKDGEPILSKIIKTGVGVATVLVGLYFLPKGVRYLFTKNYVMPVDGKCGDGFKLKGNKCYCLGDAKIADNKCIGFEGATQQKDGSWACANGYKPVNGKCAIYCDKNAHLVANQDGDKCICEKGYLQTEDKCVKESNCKEGFHLNIFTGECNSNDSCAKTGFVSLPDETCGCPKGTTLTDGECKDFVKPSSQYLMLAECPKNFTLNWNVKACNCNGAATLENGECIPHKNAEYSNLSRGWVCPENRVSENEACVCDSSKRFVPSSDGDACVCEKGFVKTTRAGCVEANKCGLGEHLDLYSGGCVSDVTGAIFDSKANTWNCEDPNAELAGSKCVCKQGFKDTLCGCKAIPRNGDVGYIRCEPYSKLKYATYNATTNSYECGDNGVQSGNECKCKHGYTGTACGCMQTPLYGYINESTCQPKSLISKAKYNEKTNSFECPENSTSFYYPTEDGRKMHYVCTCNSGFTETKHGCIKTPENGRVNQKTGALISDLKGIVKYDAENNAFVCGENAEEHGWIFKSCDCKKEYVNVNGECVRDTCEPGLTLKEDGKCHCNIDGATYDENKKLCVCPENMKVNKAGDKCICADGYSMTRNGCMKNNCPIGAALDHFGRCTTIKDIEFERDQKGNIISARCPKGKELSEDGNKCVSVCAKGYVYNPDNEKCYKEAKKSFWGVGNYKCSEGETLNKIKATGDVVCFQKNG